MSLGVRYWAVVPAAGVGRRMGGEVPKQYLQVAGQAVLQHTLERLLAVPVIVEIVVALGVEDGFWEELPVAHHPRVRRVAGGKERADSVLAGLEGLAGRAAAEDWVLVHDAARPCLTAGDVLKLIEELGDDPVGGILAVPVSDTLKRVEAGHGITTVDRRQIWRALTPQMFRYGALRQALTDAAAAGHLVTDEASALELQGLHPRIVEGRPDNIKITRPEDLPLAAFYLTQQCSE